MPRLISPTVHLRDSWLASREEWGRGVNQDGSGLHPGDDVDTLAGFSEWAGGLRRQADPALPVPEGRVPATYWWIAEDDTYVGAITLRHALNDFLLRAGGNSG